jgi:hypothetical protein
MSPRERLISQPNRRRRGAGRPFPTRPALLDADLRAVLRRPGPEAPLRRLRRLGTTGCRQTGIFAPA